MNIWRFPRPALFLDSIETAVRDGSNVIVRFASSAPAGLERELRQRLHSLRLWTSLDASDLVDDPVRFLRERVCPDVSSLRAGTMSELADTDEFQGRLLWVEKVRRLDWACWADALAAYADACRRVEVISRTLFVVVLSGSAVAGGVPEELTLVRRDFRNVLDSLEMFMFALWQVPERVEAREHRALMAHVVAQVAGWDWLLAEQLLSVSLEETLNPEEVLRGYAERRGWTRTTARRWENGTVDGPGDQPFVHSALLCVSGEKKLVRRRVWAAQAAVVLPLVDERRVGLVHRWRRYLSLPVTTERGQLVHDALDLEIGQVARNLIAGEAPRRVRDYARWLVDVRNRLAHLEPLEPDDALNRILLSDL